MKLLCCFSLLIVMVVPAEGWGFSSISSAFSSVVNSFSTTMCMYTSIFGGCNKIDGNWGAWGKWSVCSGGEKKRIRKCDNPTPKNGGKVCSGGSIGTEKCQNGKWGSWGSWSECSEGVKKSYRKCDNPAPYNGGTGCSPSGGNVKTETCQIDGKWDDWEPFGDCSKTCGNGTKSRSRKCIEPKFGGTNCEGISTEVIACNVQKCKLQLDPAIKGYLDLIISGVLKIENSTLEAVLEALGEKYAISVEDLSLDDAEQLFDLLYEEELKDLDLNNDGVTSLKELQTVLKTLVDEPELPPPPPPGPEENDNDINEELKTLIYKKIDKNKDGSLTAKEVKKALKKLKWSNSDIRKQKLNSKSAQELEDFVLDIARTIDENGNNMISKEEHQRYKNKQLCKRKGPFCGIDYKVYDNFCDMMEKTNSSKSLCNKRCMKKMVCTVQESSGDTVGCKEFANKCEALQSGVKAISRGSCLQELCRRKSMKQICDTDKMTHDNPCDAADKKNVKFSHFGACA